VAGGVVGEFGRECEVGVGLLELGFHFRAQPVCRIAACPLRFRESQGQRGRAVG